MRRKTDNIIAFPEMRVLNTDPLHLPVASIAAPRVWFVRRWTEFKPNPSFARIFCSSPLSGACPHRDTCGGEYCDRESDD